MADLAGLAGVFLAVFISHFIPFIPLPGYLATIEYASLHRDLPTLFLTAAVTALAASLGKLAVFAYGYGIGKAVAGEELEYAKRLFQKISKFGIDVAVFVFAISPLADDVLYIPLGAAGYDIKRFFLSVFAGKFVLASIIVALGRAVSAAVEAVVGDTLLSVAVMAAITVALTVLVLRIKWSEVLKSYEEGGARRAAVALLRSMLRRR